MELDLLEKVEEEMVENYNQGNKEFSVMVNRTDLLKALAHAQSVVEKNNIIPILSHIKLVAEGGMIEFTATNTEIAIVEKIKAEINVSGALAVAAHTLYDIVRKLPEDINIELAVDNKKKSRVNVVAGNCHFSLPFLAVDAFPIMEYGEMSHKFLMNASELAMIFDKNRHFISTEETRYNLNGIYIHTINKDGNLAFRAVAIDGHRLSRVELLKIPVGAENMPGIIIPRKTILEIRKLINSNDLEISVEISTTKIKFMYGDLMLISKLIDGTFPEYDALIPYNNKYIVRVDSEGFTQAVDRVSTISFEKLRAVKFTIQNNKLTLSAVDEIHGAATETLEISHSEKDIEIGFNSRYLLDVMSVIKGKTVEFLFGDDHYAPVVIRDADDIDSLYVVMPLLI
ncbi:MAG: DNA polymerase III subunit beta [Rickettsiales endosymbiont of Dermacentor nuttalli]